MNVAAQTFGEFLLRCVSLLCVSAYQGSGKSIAVQPTCLFSPLHCSSPTRSATALKSQDFIALTGGWCFDATSGIWIFSQMSLIWLLLLSGKILLLAKDVAHGAWCFNFNFNTACRDFSPKLLFYEVVLCFTIYWEWLLTHRWQVLYK